MRIIGLDPGIAIVGYAVVDKQAHQIKPVQYGAITTEAGLPTEERLLLIYNSLKEIIERYQPDQMAIEKLFFNRNVTTAFTVGQARGVMMLAAAETKLKIAEYTPLQVKQAVVGYGQAEKRQVQEMVKMLLGLKEKPKPDDVADALAVAICHAHASTVNTKLNEQLARRGMR